MDNEARLVPTTYVGLTGRTLTPTGLIERPASASPS